MIVGNVLLGLALVCLLWGTVSAVLIAAALQRRGVDVSFLFLRLMVLKYVGQYRALTLRETGKVGPLFYSFVFAMSLALVATILGLVIRGG